VISLHLRGLRHCRYQSLLCSCSTFFGWFGPRGQSETWGDPDKTTSDQTSIGAKAIWLIFWGIESETGFGLFWRQGESYPKYPKITTPWKINMEHSNHPFRKENDLPNLCVVHFWWCTFSKLDIASSMQMFCMGFCLRKITPKWVLDWKSSRNADRLPVTRWIIVNDYTFECPISSTVFSWSQVVCSFLFNSCHRIKGVSQCRTARCWTASIFLPPIWSIVILIGLPWQLCLSSRVVDGVPPGFFVVKVCRWWCVGFTPHPRRRGRLCT